MKKEKITIDIDCESRGISGEISFDQDEFDQLEVMEIAEMIIRVIESWCNKRTFMHENIKEYNVVFN